MRLSEAIALGSLLLKHTFSPGQIEGTGCALQMGLEAVGRNTPAACSETWQVWPWVEKTVVPCPACGKSDQAHVVVACCLNDKHHWPIDKIVSWVRSVEPAEETPSSAEAVCHRTNESSGTCESSRDAELPELAKEAGE